MGGLKGSLKSTGNVAQSVTLPPWAVALVTLVTSYAAHNFRVAMAFLATPEPFATLSEAAQCMVFDAAMSLHGIGLRMPRVPKATWEDATYQRGLSAIKGRSAVAFVWVHQRYAPLPEPGNARLPSLSVAYEGLREAGDFGPNAPEYVNAVTALCAKPDKVSQADYDAHRAKLGISGEPVLAQRAMKGGYGVATVAALAAQPEKAKGTGTVNLDGLRALLK